MFARCLLFTCVLGILFLTLSPVSADIPELTSYQGKVTDLSGNPVADGSYSMRFRIYNVSTGGSPLWDSGVQTVSVAGGVFSILLGESPQPVLDLAFDEDYWLLVTFDGINQLPRQRLTSIGYAYMASGLVPGTVVSGALTSGNVFEVENTAQDGVALRAVTSYAANPTQAGTAIFATTSGNGPAIEGHGGSNGGSTGLYGSGMAVGVKGIVSDFMGTSIGPDIGVDGEAEYYNVYGSYGVRGQGQSHGGYFIGGSVGVYGRPSATAAGTGVYGEATATTGITYGVLGMSESTSGKGVYGEATAMTGITYGVHGKSESTSGSGVYGEGYHGVYGNGDSYGGYFVAPEDNGTGVRGNGYRGVHGESNATNGLGVLGRSWAATGDAKGVQGTSYSVSGTGVYGYTQPSSGTTRGVHGVSNSTAGTGVHGEATATTGTTYGVFGESESTSGRGVYGHALATSGECFGGRFETGSISGRGVFAHAYSGSGTTYGVYGRSDSPSGWGVYGQAPFTGVYGLASGSSGINYGVFGKSYSTSGYGGYFEGDVHVFGSLSKSSGSFLIDHPLDPENKLLRHNFMESPENLVVYRGKAQLDEYGEAVVEMPEYFRALTKEDAATVNLTSIGKGPFDSSYEWNKDFSKFTIYGEPGREIAWTVYADRDDPTMRRLWRPVEEDKGPDNKYCDRGKLLDPVAYGYPESMGRNYELQESIRPHGTVSPSANHRHPFESE